MALRIARAATGRFKTVSFWDAFHGAGFGASAVGGEATFRSGSTGNTAKPRHVWDLFSQAQGLTASVITLRQTLECFWHYSRKCRITG